MDRSRFTTSYREKSWLDPRITLGHSSIHGKGLFAAEPFRVGEVLIVFGGSLFSREDIAAGKANNRTLMQVDENLWLGDPADQTLGEDYFINHSCDPNLWITEGVNLIARREIIRGEEVTMDYATHFADASWTMNGSCHCGSKLCRRVITGRDWMLQDLQERYSGHFSPLLKMRISALPQDYSDGLWKRLVCYDNSCSIQGGPSLTSDRHRCFRERNHLLLSAENE